MKAMRVAKPGPLENAILLEHPAPEPPTGWLRVRLSYVALNRLDLWVIHGLPVAPYPVTLGADGAGVIDAVGTGVDPARIGENVLLNPTVSCGACSFCREGEESMCDEFRLLGEHMDGTLAEYVIVPAQNAVPRPRGYDARTAAAIGVTYVTAWRMLRTRAQLQAGETCLILGIGAGVSVAALQIARRLGAHVWVTSSDDAKLEKAQKMGAEWGINYRSTEDWNKAVFLQSGKRGVDVVFDSVGGPTWKQSMRVLRRGGRLVNCGATAGRIGETDITRLFALQLSLHGSTMGSRREFAELLDAFGNWPELTPVIDREFDGLEQAPNALAYLESQAQMGKVLVRVRDESA